ncbi:MAG: hypothetical protein QNL14_01580 [Deltaproteobacteria bacterium]|nr:hypothetical protein [Deltaproteobacteria bacterium]
MTHPVHLETVCGIEELRNLKRYNRDVESDHGQTRAHDIEGDTHRLAIYWHRMIPPSSW